jgi:hypothetical protein
LFLTIERKFCLLKVIGGMGVTIFAIGSMGKKINGYAE